MPQNFDLLANIVQVHHEQFSFWVWCSRFECLIISEIDLNQTPDPSIPWETNLMKIHRLFHPFYSNFLTYKMILHFTARYGHVSYQWIRKVWSMIYSEYQGHRESLFRTTLGPRLTWNYDFVKLNRISIFKILTKNIIVYGKDVDRLGFSVQLN